MIPSNIKTLISETYKKAVANGAIKFTETVSTQLKDPKTKVPYLVSYAPSLALKPKRDNTEENQSTADPFANPERELTVLSDLTGDGSYQLLLNKYPIIPEHALLVTKDYQSQTSALSPKELKMAYDVLVQLDSDAEQQQHLMFYNSGPASGSSQDHKHLQVFPLPPQFEPFQTSLCSNTHHFIPDQRTEPLQNPEVSFAHFALPLPESPEDVDEDLLAMSYFALLQRALSFFQDWLGEHPDLKRSYNFLMTKKWLCVVPRSHESANIKEQEQEEERDGKFDVDINSAGYAGLLLVKSQESYDALLEDPAVIDKLMLACGFANTAGVKPGESDY